MEMTMMNGFGFYELSQEEQNSVNEGEFPWGEVATAVISVAVAAVNAYCEMEAAASA